MSSFFSFFINNKRGRKTHVAKQYIKMQRVITIMWWMVILTQDLN